MLAYREKEYMVVMPFEPLNRLLKVIEIYHYPRNPAIMYVGKLLKPALQWNTVAILATHNHPTIDLKLNHQFITN